jgi:hypothetical protein
MLRYGDDSGLAFAKWLEIFLGELGYGATTTLSITTLSIMALGIKTFSKKTFGIKTFSKKTAKWHSA